MVEKPATLPGGVSETLDPQGMSTMDSLGGRKARPKFEAALDTCREIKAHAPHCRVILTVYEMKRLGRDSAELTALADHLTAHGIALEMLAGPLTAIYDPTGAGR